MSSYPTADQRASRPPETPAARRSTVRRTATQLRISRGALAAAIRELRSLSADRGASIGERQRIDDAGQLKDPPEGRGPVAERQPI